MKNIQIYVCFCYSKVGQSDFKHKEMLQENKIMWGKVGWKYEFKERKERGQNSNFKKICSCLLKMSNDWC